MFIKTSDGVDLYVKVSGKGEPCIFLHGGPGSWSGSFEELGGNILESFMNIIYLDQRGCGRSGKVQNEDFSLKRVIDDLEEVRKHLNIKKWHIMAHSFGGILAVNYMHIYPEAINSAILLNCTLNLEYSIENQISNGIKLLGLHNSSEYTDRSVHYMERFSKIAGFLNEKNLYYKVICGSKESFEKLNLIDSKFNNDFKFQGYVLSHEEYLKDYTPITEDIHIPVLVVSGENDISIGPEHHKAFRFKNQKLFIASEGSHFWYHENNADFYNCIKEFTSNYHL